MFAVFIICYHVRIITKFCDFLFFLFGISEQSITPNSALIYLLGPVKPYSLRIVQRVQMHAIACSKALI